MSIMESMNIGSNALRAHGLRLDIHAKNIENANLYFIINSNHFIFS